MARHPDFPADEALWLLKWIDGVLPGHGASRSPSIGLALQRLSLNPVALARLTRQDVPTIVGATHDQPPEYAERRVLVGALPGLEIGQVFQNGTYIGELPSTLESCALRAGEAGLEEVSVDTSRTRLPPGWSPQYRYTVLQSREYALPGSAATSRCLVIAREPDVEIVLPRSVVFKRFFAAHTHLANAVLRGPFSRTLQDVICTTLTESGLITAVDAATGQWNVILQRAIPNEFAPLMALLYFDAYARASADRIYTQALQDRSSADRRTKALGGTVLRARLPFDPKLGASSLRLKGVWLNDRWRGSERVKRTFLATSIVAADFPANLPDIGYERANSGGKGESVRHSTEPAPYRSPEPEAADPNVPLDHRHDPTVQRGRYFEATDEFSWSRLPRLVKLEKRSSTRYDDAGRVGPSADPSSTASTGLAHHGSQAPAALHQHSLHRPQCHRFEGLLRAVDHLVTQRVIDRVDILTPLDPAQRADRGGRPAWSFLDARSRRNNRWPSSGWRLLSRDALVNRRRAPRCALVLRLGSGPHSITWIEIEGRSSGDTYYSPILFARPDPTHATIEAVIEAIAQNEGTHLQDVLAPLLRSLDAGLVRCYRHRVQDNDGAFDPESLRRVLGW